VHGAIAHIEFPFLTFFITIYGLGSTRAHAPIVIHINLGIINDNQLMKKMNWFCENEFPFK
jgi:hypothetical protein